MEFTHLRFSTLTTASDRLIVWKDLEIVVVVISSSTADFYIVCLLQHEHRCITAVHKTLRTKKLTKMSVLCCVAVREFTKCQIKVWEVSEKNLVREN